MQGLNLLFGNVRITDVKYPKLFTPLKVEVKEKQSQTTLKPVIVAISCEPQYSVYDLATMLGWYEVQLPRAMVTFFVTKAGEAKRVRMKRVK